MHARSLLRVAVISTALIVPFGSVQGAGQSQSARTAAEYVVVYAPAARALAERSVIPYAEVGVAVPMVPVAVAHAVEGENHAKGLHTSTLPRFDPQLIRVGALTRHLDDDLSSRSLDDADVPDELKTEVDDIRQGIIDGSIQAGG